MKTNILALLSLCLSAFAFASCTTSTTTTASRDRSADVVITDEKRSYSQAELKRRGQPTVGGALEAQDASVRVSGAR
jgi:hypothetical protein